MHDRISQRQLTALCFCAVCVPVFRLCCRISWAWTALGGLGAAILLSVLYRLAARRPLARAAAHPAGKTQLTILTLSLLTLAGWGGAESARAFPETVGSPAAAWLMLGLAAWAALHGAAALGRCAAILMPASIILYGIVLGFSAPQIRPERLVPSGTPGLIFPVLAALLVPAAGICLQEDGASALPRKRNPFLLTALLASAASAETAGILSPAGAAREGSFDVLARSVSILGVMQRFEALVCAAMLMSGFCLCGLFLGAAASVLTTLAGQRKGKRFFALLLPVSGFFSWADLPGFPLWAGLTAICSGLMACLLPEIEAKKNLKNFLEN